LGFRTGKTGRGGAFSEAQGTFGKTPGEINHRDLEFARDVKARYLAWTSDGTGGRGQGRGFRNRGHDCRELSVHPFRSARCPLTQDPTGRNGSALRKSARCPRVYPRPIRLRKWSNNRCLLRDLRLTDIGQRR